MFTKTVHAHDFCNELYVHKVCKVMEVLKTNRFNLVYLYVVLLILVHFNEWDRNSQLQDNHTEFAHAFSSIGSEEREN